MLWEIRTATIRIGPIAVEQSCIQESYVSYTEAEAVTEGPKSAWFELDLFIPRVRLSTLYLPSRVGHLPSYASAIYACSAGVYVFDQKEGFLDEFGLPDNIWIFCDIRYADFASSGSFKWHGKHPRHGLAVAPRQCDAQQEESSEVGATSKYDQGRSLGNSNIQKT